MIRMTQIKAANIDLMKVSILARLKMALEANIWLTGRQAANGCNILLM